MAIVLTNDDGIAAPGLTALANALAGLDDLVVVAPATNQSGVGMGISLDRELPASTHDLGIPGLTCRAIDGTPADAVKYALQHVVETPPRLVVSGINLGPNLGRNIRCSGTVGAALEAAISGIPALAVSVDYVIPPDWSGAQYYARLLAERLLADPPAVEEAIVYNLNVPSAPPESIPGLAVARHGVGGFHDVLAAVDGTASYRMDGEWVVTPPSGDCDAAAFGHGYAVVTPLRFEMTHTALINTIADRWRDIITDRPRP